ncbi:MAG: hypothetical protein JSW27_15025 [Phycisphaerales bacterium]|nr:MAG: hypothetical protein JSW27_15025 [Phycisphaerales bacterium]
MPKKKLVPFRIEEEWLQDLRALAGTFDVSPEDVIRQSLPEAGVVRLFFQCKSYLTELRWDEVAAVGREAIREHLRTKYLEGLKQHLARLGVSIDASGDEVEAAKKRVLDEMKADTDRLIERQLHQAETDSVYLGYLYEAWKRALAGEDGYTITQVHIPSSGSRDSEDPQTVWAVLKDNHVV